MSDRFERLEKLLALSAENAITTQNMIQQMVASIQTKEEDMDDADESMGWAVPGSRT